MKKSVKNISPAIFGIIVICFFLPFINVSCSDQKLMSFTAFQMVTGTTIQQPSMFGENTERQEVDPEPLAIAIFACVIAGLLLSFIKNRKTAILPLICAIVGIATLLMLKSKIDNDVLNEGGGILQIDYVFGFWSILLLLIIAVLLNGYVFSGKDEEKLEK